MKPINQFSKEDGNVESALVLIPMLVLFLIGIQVIVATNIRNADMALAQGLSLIHISEPTRPY